LTAAERFSEICLGVVGGALDSGVVQISAA